MAPEQIEIEPVDARTDVYSLSIAAFEMATGRRPFPDDVCEVMRAHITQQTPDPRKFVADLPKEFAEFVSKATQKDPSARYQDMMEVVDDLKPLARKLGARSRIESHGKRRLVNLFMAYEDTRQLELKRLLEEFNEGVRSLGGEIRMAEFEDF